MRAAVSIAGIFLLASAIVSTAEANTIAPDVKCTFLWDRAVIETHYPGHSLVALYDNGRVKYQDAFKEILFEPRGVNSILYDKAPGTNVGLYSLQIFYRQDQKQLSLSAGLVWQDCLDRLQDRFSDKLTIDEL